MNKIQSQADDVVVRKVSDPFGFLGNMSPHPVKYKGYAYRTAEALFQCMRFEDEEIQTLIWDQPSPMGAKMVAKGKRELMKVAPQSDTDIENMENVLTMKTDQHLKIESQLLATGV